MLLTPWGLGYLGYVDDWGGGQKLPQANFFVLIAQMINLVLKKI
jgi:hypothetical protein